MSSSSPTREKDHAPSSEAESADESTTGAEDTRLARRTKKGRKTATRSGGGQSSLPLDKLPVSGVDGTASNALSGVTNTLGSVANNTMDNARQGQGSGGGKSDTLRLRLDLNLDIEITLKAKIHGDLELALL